MNPKPGPVLAVTCPGCGKPWGHEDLDRELIAVLRAEAIQAVLEDTARTFGLSVEHLTGRKRVRELTEARREAVRRLRAGGLMLKEIGFLFGGRDHSTIIKLLQGS
jgi:chromosomal replication initiation ATPase DnaA